MYMVSKVAMTSWTHEDGQPDAVAWSVHWMQEDYAAFLLLDDVVVAREVAMYLNTLPLEAAYKLASFLDNITMEVGSEDLTAGMRKWLALSHENQLVLIDLAGKDGTEWTGTWDNLLEVPLLVTR